MDKKKLGYYGEDAVCSYLEHRGYILLARNYTVKGGEIDIIASHGAILAFVEVKTRTVDCMVNGFDAITRAKKRLIIKTALRYMERYPTNLQPRFDAAEVLIQNHKIIRMDYIENAFDATDMQLIF